MRTSYRALALGTTVGVATWLALTPYKIHLDSQVPESKVKQASTEDTTGLKVYSVGFYADLNNPALKVPLDMSPEDKVKYIVRNTSCVVRIIPTRSTNFTHLRDAFMRSLQARLGAGIKDRSITEEIAQSVSSPMRKLKSLFPNSPFIKHTPLDIYLTAPVPGKPRALVFRDLGTIEDDWVATELVLNYFEGEGPSPPVRISGSTSKLKKMARILEYLTQPEEQIDHFLEFGYIVIKKAFTKQKAEEWTKDLWVRLNLDPNDKSTWNQERIHMPSLRREKVATFAPTAWAAIKDLLGGEERINEAASTWGDSFIVNLGTDHWEKATEKPAPQDLDNWHVDGDFFVQVHYLDSPEQALLVIPIYSDIKPSGGGTMISPDGIDLIANYLAAHPEGVVPTGLSFTPSTNKYEKQEDDSGYWSHLKEIKRCKQFVEMTGEPGDVVLMHPLMLHSASKNYLRIPRVITNPPVSLKEPFGFNRDDPADYSIVERKTLKALGVERFPFEITTERRRIVPARVAIQQKMMEEEKKRLVNLKEGGASNAL
ncbi:hypothetical protein NLJ89_g2877 [Agrocybe chaxingu]|uniref:Chalcone isomerase domain-containing protein n=1 Tax=Agrocybe chaxingu TaxID=84603 RepID=A0A9W8K6N4_9AGAR|nr:hypothetical protein NLJ89_g2877 [Agrocybe chaxingu]